MSFWTQLRREALVGALFGAATLVWIFWYLTDHPDTSRGLLSVFGGAGLVAATTVLRCGYMVVKGRRGDYPFGPLN